jgi:hypothetical protein
MGHNSCWSVLMIRIYWNIYTYYDKQKHRNFDASREAGLEVNAWKTKHVLLFYHQNVGQNRDIKIATRSFENVAQLNYYGMTVQIKICVGRKYEEFSIQTLPTIQSRTFCFLVCCLEM